MYPVLDPQNIWFIDFEYQIQDGDPLPKPICWVAQNLLGHQYSAWIWEASHPAPPPIPPSGVMVAYHVPAELSCYLACGWPMPLHVIDMCVEFRLRKNGTSFGASLLAALEFFHIDHHVDAPTKVSPRALTS